MQLRDRNKLPWRLKITEIFEKAFDRAGTKYSRDKIYDILDDFDHDVTRDPYQCGRSHSVLDAYIYEHPVFQGQLKISIIFTIDDENGVVVANNLNVKN